MGEVDRDYGGLSDDDVAEIEENLFEVQPCSADEMRTGNGDGDDDGDGDDYSLSEFDYTVWIDEGAEEILGDDRFDTLVDAFSSIDGVVEVVQEDREVFFFKAPDLSAAQLEEELRRVYFEMKRLN